MSRSDAAGHLSKARELLIYIVLTGTTGKSEDHRVASAELRRAGPLGAGCANDLDRLLGIKSRVQHQPAPTSATDSVKAVDRARGLVAAAAQVAAG